MTRGKITLMRPHPMELRMLAALLQVQMENIRDVGVRELSFELKYMPSMTKALKPKRRKR